LELPVAGETAMRIPEKAAAAIAGLAVLVTLLAIQSAWLMDDPGSASFGMSDSSPSKVPAVRR
jgi:hypothetical protein